jgi:hypothetical protein
MSYITGHTPSKAETQSTGTQCEGWWVPSDGMGQMPQYFHVDSVTQEGGPPSSLSMKCSEALFACPHSRGSNHTSTPRNSYTSFPLSLPNTGPAGSMGPPPLPHKVYAGASAAVPAPLTQPYHGGVGTSQHAFPGTALGHQRNLGVSPVAGVLGGPMGVFPIPGNQQAFVTHHQPHGLRQGPGGYNHHVQGSAQQAIGQPTWLPVNGVLTLHYLFQNPDGSFEYRLSQ